MAFEISGGLVARFSASQAASEASTSSRKALASRRRFADACAVRDWSWRRHTLGELVVIGRPLFRRHSRQFRGASGRPLFLALEDHPFFARQGVGVGAGVRGRELEFVPVLSFGRLASMKFTAPVRKKHELLARLAIALAAGAAPAGRAGGQALGVDPLHEIGATFAPCRRAMKGVKTFGLARKSHARLPMLFYLKDGANLNLIGRRDPAFGGGFFIRETGATGNPGFFSKITIRMGWPKGPCGFTSLR
nr:hypothetical protein [Methylocapsa palsarum]